MLRYYSQFISQLNLTHHPLRFLSSIEIQELRSELLSTKLHLQSTQSDVQTRDSLLLKARKAIENLRTDLQISRTTSDTDRTQTDKLKREVEGLNTVVKDWEGKWSGCSFTLKNLEEEVRTTGGREREK